MANQAESLKQIEETKKQTGWPKIAKTLLSNERIRHARVLSALPPKTDIG
jgi:hypothetical protein